jgi:hypothetical protein
MTIGLGTVIPTVSNTIGAVIVGWGVSSLYVPVSRDRVLHSQPPIRDSLFGMLCLQVWSYYIRYTNDSTSYKLLVCGYERRSTEWCWLTLVQVLSLWYALPYSLPPPRVAEHKSGY